jgi:hypothetical protein
VAAVITLVVALWPAGDDPSAARQGGGATTAQTTARIVGFGAQNDTKRTRIAAEDVPVEVGDRLTYRLDVRNESDEPAQETSVSFDFSDPIPLLTEASVSTADGVGEHGASVSYDPGRYVGALVVDPDSIRIGDPESDRWRPYRTRQLDGSYRTSPIELGDLPPDAARAIVFSAKAERQTGGGQVAGGGILQAHVGTGTRAPGRPVVTVAAGEQIVFGLLLDNPTPALPVYDVRARISVATSTDGGFARVRASIDWSSSAPRDRRVSAPVTVNFGDERRLRLDYVEGSTELVDVSPALGGTGRVLHRLDDGIAQGGIVAVEQLGSGRLRSRHHGTEDTRWVRFRMRAVDD